MSNFKRIAAILVTVFLTFTIFAIPVLAVNLEPDTPSGDDAFLCAIPLDGQFYVLCSEVDPNYERGADYSWLMDQYVFSFRYPTGFCHLVYFTPANGYQTPVVDDINDDGGSDPSYTAGITITKAMVEQSTDGYLYDKLWLNFSVKDNGGNTVFPTTTSSPGFVDVLDARGMVYLPTNEILLKIASFMPQTSPNIFDYVRGSTFSNGYNRGFADGQRDGYQVGKNDTYQPAYDSGYNAGYQKAMIDSDTFTFRGFLDAVIFAPIDACLQIFDFDFLGFNMRGFVAAVLTLVIIGGIVLVILKFKGGGS